jgi:ubiquinone/menaquinone biosynthesis C-methylase UbiE
MNEYDLRGEYHKNLDPNWSYYPIYTRKIKFVEAYIQRNVNTTTQIILDAGCGEGVMVENFRSKGYNIIGVDKFYSSKIVLSGDILDLPFNDNSFDYILFLDVIEHLFFPDQIKALNELYRVLKNDGKLILSVPNLSHLASRVSFFFTGKLKRTANIAKHPGDRPISEYIELFDGIGFSIKERFPIELTFGNKLKSYFKKIITKDLYEKFFYSHFHNPNLCFLNIFILEIK